MLHFDMVRIAKKLLAPVHVGLDRIASGTVITAQDLTVPITSVCSSSERKGTTTLDEALLALEKEAEEVEI